ncbi:hypothetical protein [Candidatus Vidania fulgoroideorum]
MKKKILKKKIKRLLKKIKKGDKEKQKTLFSILDKNKKYLKKNKINRIKKQTRNGGI